MMKKMTSLIILIFVFFTCAAPELTREQKQEYRDNVINMLARQVREAEFGRFIDHLLYKESSGRWETVNLKGCIGGFQFSPSTLTSMGYGYITLAAFKADPGIFPPELQLRVLRALIKSNELYLKPYIGFVGKVIDGTPITRSGIIAAAHLGGAMSVMLYLSSGGKINNSDAFATSIRDYMREFAGYNI